MEKVLESAEYEIFYRKIGSGNPVVLIHGFGEDGAIWEELIDNLKDQYEFLIPDVPGSGRSVVKGGKWSIDDLAGSIAAILDHEQILSAPMIGHSMGGYIALAFAEKYPGRLNALGLFHSSAFADTEDKKTTRKRGIQFIEEHGQAKFLEQATPNLFSEIFREENPQVVTEIIDRYTNFQDTALVHYYEAMMQRPDRTQVLKNFSHPVLFILGEHDTAIPLADGLKQCHIPRLSYIHILRNSGHMGMVEEPIKSRGILQKFLEDL